MCKAVKIISKIIGVHKVVFTKGFKHNTKPADRSKIPTFNYDKLRFL